MELTQLKPKSVRHPKTGKTQGFTLAELLISLAILGVIATFTIPKILSAQQASANNAKAKEVAAMISAAFQQAKLDGTITATTYSRDLIPYLNYLKLDTSGTVIDTLPGFASASCSVATPCVYLHNGGVLWFHDTAFGGTSNLNVIEFAFDPDPINNTTATADGPLKAVQFGVYYNGFITSRGKFKSGSVNHIASLGLNSAFDPSWFSWN